MPITRTPIVDDDGSGQTGTILNNSWKQELYNQIDAFVAAPDMTGALSLSGPWRIPSAINITLTASQNNWNPAGGSAKIVWNLIPSAGLLLTGLVAEAMGTMHLLINNSGNPLLLYNQHANSSAANRFTGPGYADYTLGVWRSAWIRYSEVGSWIILVP